MRRPPLVVVSGLLAVAFLAGVARADDYVTLRGAYYREPSTRVIQPTVEVERDDDSGVDVKAHFLVDTITSASVSAGTAADTIFTETRNEVGLSVRKRWSRSEIGLGYKYSAESDYWSHAVGVSASQRFWGDTARVGVSLGLNFDTVASRFRTPACATPPSTACSLDGRFVGVNYTQILSPDLLAQVSAEATYLDGFQGNLYRSVPNFGYEVVPDKRLRAALAGRVAYYVAATDTSLRLAYRYYTDFGPGDRGADDPWRIQSHMVEGRVYQPLTRTLEVRLSYRQYFQSRAQFWCDALGRPGCYPPAALYYSTDPKLGAVRTEYPEVKLLWTAEALTDIPVAGWLAAGTFDISYGRYFQNTSFGNAHVLQLGYTMPY
ncbi:MAG: hypothetical protein JWM82_3412 [Myxococcales bacterium]|nr:hypothetical protein [Myxococcales bacterium]